MPESKNNQIPINELPTDHLVKIVTHYSDQADGVITTALRALFKRASKGDKRAAQRLSDIDKQVGSDY